MITAETIAIRPEAEKYATTYGRNDQHYTDTIREAVQYGLSLTQLETKSIGCPLDHVAYDYALQFEEFGTEQKFRIQQAVKYGHSIIKEPMHIDSIFHKDRRYY
jgi:hypothetical protein